MGWKGRGKRKQDQEWWRQERSQEEACEVRHSQESMWET
ncbi:hypothetical protein T09_13075 [Trichinella sp. T9]|nr:hypothetical protein T09_13075 [Trichinella sp. T9]